MTIVVTGAAGFIGSNIVRGLNARGIKNVIAVDALKGPDSFRNLVDLEISDYFDSREFIEVLRSQKLGEVDAIFHQGACSDTMEQDGQYVIANNYRYSKDLLDICGLQSIRLLYASSAATYGNSTDFSIDPVNEKPLNVYGYSKLLFDQVSRKHMMQGDAPQLAGFRYFNVYGAGESEKGRMASVAFHHMQQLRDDGFVRLFGAYDGVEAGCQSRDFVYVRDVVDVNLFFFDHPELSGIYNLGSGRSEPFNEVAKSVINCWRRHRGESALELEEQIEQGLLRYVDFPEALKGKYQSYTRADITGLREAGYRKEFGTVSKGVSEYFSQLQASEWI